MCNTENKTCTRGNFGNVFFKNILETGDILIACPYSLQMALLIAFIGSAQSTKEAFKKVLRIDDVGEEYKALIDLMSQNKAVNFTNVNKIYVKTGLSIIPSYTDAIANNFQAEIENINFKESAKSAKTINAWVTKKTNNKIKELVSPTVIDDSTELVILNAVYFKANWAMKFKKGETTKDEFHLPDGSNKTVDMMHITGLYNHADVSEIQASIIELPYEGEEFSMLVILPYEMNGITKLRKTICNYDITQFELRKTEVIVALPRFKIESEYNLEGILSQMGLQVIFEEEADFSGISEQALKVSKVVQKAFIEVNEDGTEAAAATGMTLMFRSMPLSFIANHGFLFVIKFKGAPIFTGLYS